MDELTKAVNVEKQKQLDRWDEGLANHEKLKKLLPFLNEDDGYL